MYISTNQQQNTFMKHYYSVLLLLLLYVAFARAVYIPCFQESDGKRSPRAVGFGVAVGTAADGYDAKDADGGDVDDALAEEVEELRKQLRGKGGTHRTDRIPCLRGC